MSDTSIFESLTTQDLYRRCDPATLTFETTAELSDLSEMVGQDRAVEAIHFGVNNTLHGYNIFVLGPQGTGRHSYVQRHLGLVASAKPVADDWCYVNNFSNSRAPIALRLPPGKARAFRSDVEKLIDEAYAAIPAAFESENYFARRQAIEQDFQKEQARLFQEVQKHAEQRGIALIRTPSGIIFAPIRDGQALTPQDFEKMPAAERERIEARSAEVGDEFQQAMHAIPHLIRTTREKLLNLEREIAMLAAGNLIDDLLEKYAALPKVVAHLHAVQNDIIENVGLFRTAPDGPSVSHADGFHWASPVNNELPARRRYGVNVLVDNGDLSGAPLLTEDHPTYPHIVGEIEHVSHMGALLTDFSLIKPGALHRANGGYLILDAMKVLIEPFAWQGLKQAIRNRSVRIESLWSAFSLVSAASLEPEPIPLDLKIVLIGDRPMYYMLQALDPEFAELFKVAADFDDQMIRSDETIVQFARLLATIGRKEGLLPLDRTAVARLVEESARDAEHASRLDARIRPVVDLMREASHWARESGKQTVGSADIQTAIDQRTRRLSRLRDRLQEAILEDTIVIDSTGAKPGQVNALSVLQVGEFRFAKPSRVTARVALGSGRVIDIERDTKLGGPIHSKGVLILTGYLTARYAADIPLSLSASLVVEQSYGGIEGDSASSAELYALLSAIADVPLRQSLAVTGSVDQHGNIQAIGGVNEKIEGFFDVCAARGLTGEQGVVIPATNVRHLMLRPDVVEAAGAGRFHIYAVRTIDEGIALLTGMPAGDLDEKSEFPPGTVNRRVRDRLVAFAEMRKAFGRDATSSEPIAASDKDKVR